VRVPAELVLNGDIMKLVGVIQSTDLSLWGEARVEGDGQLWDNDKNQVEADDKTAVLLYVNQGAAPVDGKPIDVVLQELKEKLTSLVDAKITKVKLSLATLVLRRTLEKNKKAKALKGQDKRRLQTMLTQWEGLKKIADTPAFETTKLKSQQITKLKEGIEMLGFDDSSDISSDLLTDLISGLKAGLSSSGLWKVKFAAANRRKDANRPMTFINLDGNCFLIVSVQLLFSIANIGEHLKGIVGHEDVKKELQALWTLKDQDDTPTAFLTKLRNALGRDINYTQGGSSQEVFKGLVDIVPALQTEHLVQFIDLGVD